MRKLARATLSSALVLLALAALLPAMASAFPPPDPGTYHQSGSVQLTFSVDPLGTVDPETGVATIGGVLSCSEPANVDEFFGSLYQGNGPRLMYLGTGPRLNEGGFDGGSGSTAPCSGRWSATIESNFATPFHPGRATFWIQVGVVAGNNNGALFPGYTGSVVLQPVKGAAR